MDGEMTAVILAGGHAECVACDGDYMPAALLPVGSELLLEHQLAWLAEAGFSSVILCLGYKADMVRSRFGDGSRFGVRLFYSVAEGPLGSAGAVKALGAASLPEDILVLHGDLYGRTDLRRMLGSHKDRRAAATLAVHDCPSGKGHAHCRRAVLGPSRAIVELPATPPSRRGTGISPLWVVSRCLLHLVAESGPSDLLMDVFPAALRRGELLYGFPDGGTLLDIGSCDDHEGLLKGLGKDKKRKRP